eukprot:1319879-Amorphochlora_amoeboformis.AAC.2
MEMEQPQSSEIKFQTVDLYGGTFKASLPSGLVDMSNVRQVPNHQEFYANADTGANVIFEINEMVKNVDDNEAVEFFFNNLAKDNDAKESKIARQGIHALGNPDFRVLWELLPGWSWYGSELS